MHKKGRVAVIGAGVVGLSACLAIQQKCPDTEVTLMADKFTMDTLSDGAGGLYSPDLHSGPSVETTRQWCRDSYLRFLELYRSEESGAAGVQLVSGFQLSTVSQEALKKPLLSELFPQRPLLEEEMHLFPKKFKYGTNFCTFVVDCNHYLPWMMKKFEGSGGKVVHKTINNFSEVSGEYDMVVNCTGLRAKQLAADPLVTAIRGQVIRVKAPWVKHFYYGNEAYIIPGKDRVTLGGIKQYDNWNPEWDRHCHDLIWDKCTELVPSLKNAEILGTWVGLRPFRQPVRVEPELVSLPSGGKLQVVHCYGHGGHGVTLSWGTAAHAATMVSSLLHQAASKL